MCPVEIRVFVSGKQHVLVREPDGHMAIAETPVGLAKAYVDPPWPLFGSSLYERTGVLFPQQKQNPEDLFIPTGHGLWFGKEVSFFDLFSKKTWEQLQADTIQCEQTYPCSQGAVRIQITATNEVK